MTEFDLLIIGSGPGGYVAAIRGAQAGLQVALVEQEQLGGVCLNWGCIPTKALLRSAEIASEFKTASEFGIQVTDYTLDFPRIVARSREVAQTNSSGVAFLMKKNKITVISGRAKLLASTANGLPRVSVESTEGIQEYSAKSVILATGAKPRSLPSYPIDGKQFLNYRHAMSQTSKPARLLVVGSGAIGLELAWFYHALGTQVTLLESQAQILPSEDAEVSRFLTLSLTKQGIRCLAGATLQGISQGEVVRAQVLDAKQGTHEVEVDQVLFAVGMTPNTAELGLADAGVNLDPQGFIAVNSLQQTTASGIYAIGDCTGKQMLAHKASAEAEVAISAIAGHGAKPIDYQHIPGCIYCHPQVASIGLKEVQAKALGIEYTLGRFPFQASGKARAAGHTEGFVKMLFAKTEGTLLGAQILGGDATEMIATLGIALEQKMTWEELGSHIFAHPTLSESLAEAALSSQKKAVHL